MNRQYTEQKIISILEYIHHPVRGILQQNLGLFSLQEISEILQFLETGNLQPIYDFLEDKKNEYLDIIHSLKIRKRYANLNNIKLKERLEFQGQQKEIEMIDFNY